MPFLSEDELKRRLRKLKKTEAILRFSGSPPPNAVYVWNRFFNLHPGDKGGARFGLADLLAMSREEYKAAVEAFFYGVYYQHYKETGFPSSSLYDPALLENFGLPPDACLADIKKKFRQLALIAHPDTGGDAERFLELMEQYHKLVGES